MNVKSSVRWTTDGALPVNSSGKFNVPMSSIREVEVGESFYVELTFDDWVAVERLQIGVYAWQTESVVIDGLVDLIDGLPAYVDHVGWTPYRIIKSLGIRVTNMNDVADVFGCELFGSLAPAVVTDPAVAASAGVQP